MKCMQVHNVGMHVGTCCTNKSSLPNRPVVPASSSVIAPTSQPAGRPASQPTYHYVPITHVCKRLPSATKQLSAFPFPSSKNIQKSTFNPAILSKTTNLPHQNLGFLPGYIVFLGTASSYHIFPDLLLSCYSAIYSIYYIYIYIYICKHFILSQLDNSQYIIKPRCLLLTLMTPRYQLALLDITSSTSYPPPSDFLIKNTQPLLSKPQLYHHHRHYRPTTTDTSLHLYIFGQILAKMSAQDRVQHYVASLDREVCRTYKSTPVLYPSISFYIPLYLLLEPKTTRAYLGSRKHRIPFPYQFRISWYTDLEQSHSFPNTLP